MKARLLVIAILVVASPCYGALIHHYEFNSDASDSVGSADGTLVGDAYVQGRALSLDGRGDYVQFSQHLIPTAGSYTVAFFGTEYSRPETFATMISQGWSSSVWGPPEGFYIGRAWDGSLRAIDFGLTSEPFPSGRHHYAVVVDTTTSVSKLFLDGVVISTLQYAIESQPSGTDTRFGRQFDSSAYTEYFHGSLADVRIYDEALSNRAIAKLATPVPGALGLFAGGSCVLLWVGRKARTRRKTPSGGTGTGHWHST